MHLPEIGTIEAYALIVDINQFTPMVSRSSKSDFIAQFVRDVLSGSIKMIEEEGGIVVSFMGDALLAILETSEDVYKSCAGIAKDLDRQCEYISETQKDYPDNWSYAQRGISLKIAIEFGWIDISTIYCDYLGKQTLLIGPPVNYANRISTACVGNRCLVGPEAFKHGMNQWINYGPYTVKGKNCEGKYQYWLMDLGDIWREGKIEPGEDTYWG